MQDSVKDSRIQDNTRNMHIMLTKTSFFHDQDGVLQLLLSSCSVPHKLIELQLPAVDRGSLGFECDHQLAGLVNRCYFCLVTRL